MKNLFFVFALLCGLTYSSDVNGQIAINNTNEAWIISYQNAQTLIPANTSTTFTIGPNPTAGRGVLQAINPNFCNNKFQASGSWQALCSFQTDNVQYFAPTLFSPAVFIFNP